MLWRLPLHRRNATSYGQVRSHKQLAYQYELLINDSLLLARQWSHSLRIMGSMSYVASHLRQRQVSTDK
jgi:hypothetical protein